MTTATLTSATQPTTTLRPADARHAIANLRDARGRAYDMHHRGEITADQLDGIIDHINDEIMAIQERLAG